MQNDKTCSEIVSALARTRSEANILLSELDLLSRAVYKTDAESFDSIINTLVRAKTANALLSVINSDNREAVLASIKSKVEGLTYLGLTIAFEPSMETIGSLNMWVKQNLGEGVALDLTINKSILGGAIVEFKGKIASFTILSKVDNYFNTNANI